ncbi:MAG: hypothetical protein GF372_06170 [Candidatus Marinimicrobia bacterium]|nr:hypothetical protein [Candidatus Neomarinimicrobiota bacterium]
MPSKEFEEFDHTADIGITIYGVSLEELFKNAGRGMFQVMRSDSGEGLLGSDRDCDQSVSIELESPDVESLLRDWMAELLYHHTTERLYFTEFSIESISTTRVKGSARGFKFRKEDENRLMDIKAVTYHGLQVTETSDGYQAQVIFDI